MTETIIQKKHCPHCTKVAVEEKSYRLSGYYFTKYTCGHTVAEKMLGVHDTRAVSVTVKEADQPVDPYDLIEAFDPRTGKKLKPRNYQITTAKFGERANGRFLVAHEMGLGKTVIPIIMARQNPGMFPMVIFCKSSLKWQWAYEMVRWLGKDLASQHLIQVIDSAREKPEPKMYDIFIISLDLLRRCDWLETFEVNTVVIDECQQIKNRDAQRTKAVVKFAASKKYVIPMSGTPIKNNAGEYFTVLNLLRPERFPTYNGYLFNYCNYYSNGWGTKVEGLNPRKLGEFKKATEDFIIRYERADVAPELPKIDRKFFHVNLDVNVEKQYKKAFVEFRDDYNSGEFDDDNAFEESGNILARLARLRHLTGLAKVVSTSDFVEEFLESSPDKKITIFHHHDDVGTTLQENLKVICATLNIGPPLRLVSSLDSFARNEMVQKFTNDPHSRVLIASTLASGEGLNLQICSDCIIMERQWNPANEEQAEGRFSRLGSIAPYISATYMIASGTIDEFFTELVEKKREIFLSTMNGQAAPPWNQGSLMRELAATLASQGGKKWSL